MNKAGALVVAGAIAAVALALAQTAPAAPAAPVVKRTVVTVSMFEMGFKLSRRSAPRGIVIFKVKNNGQSEHDFSFGGTRKTPLLQPGGSATLRLKFAKRGRFTYICTVEGHAAAGMLGTFTVKS